MLSTHTHKFYSFWVEFNVNWCRIASNNFDLGFTKNMGRFASREDPTGTRDTGPEIRDVPGNTGRLATLVTVRGTPYK